MPAAQNDKPQQVSDKKKQAGHSSNFVHSHECIWELIGQDRGLIRDRERVRDKIFARKVLLYTII
jgi:hypothetical protein